MFWEGGVNKHKVVRLFGHSGRLGLYPYSVGPNLRGDCESCTVGHRLTKRVPTEPQSILHLSRLGPYCSLVYTFEMPPGVLLPFFPLLSSARREGGWGVEKKGRRLVGSRVTSAMCSHLYGKARDIVTGTFRVMAVNYRA